MSACRASILALCLAVTAAACSSSPSRPPSQPPPSPSSFVIVAQWNSITDSDDGTPVNVTGYRLAYGGSASALDMVREFGPETTSARIVVPAGTWFLAVTAIADGVESDPSAVVSQAVPPSR